MSALGEAKVGKHYIEALRLRFPSAVLGEEWQTSDQITVTVKVNALPDVVEWLYYNQGGWISVLFGNDERSIHGNFAIYYVLSMEAGIKCYIVVRAEVDAGTAEFPSVTPKVPACVWGEREIRDMYGLKPVGLPDERRLVLPDDWPDNLHPLRKDTMDYRVRPEPMSDTENYKFVCDASGETREIPLGPLHITSDEPGHFRLFVDGEDVVDADYRMFYVHRGMEKVAETRMGYDEVPFLADRVCGICGFAHSVAYATSVENALGIKVPDRAQVIRSVFLEVERLHSHLLNLGLACHFVGFDTGFMQFFRVREKSMTLAELLTGARKTYGMNLIGGIRRDIHKAERQATLKIIGELKQEVTELVEMLLDTPNLAERTSGIGKLERKIARDYSPVGPHVRASGFNRDTRADHPFCGYKMFQIPVRYKDTCDVLGRVLNRVEEFFDSIDFIERALDGMPNGPILVEGFKYTPHKFALGFVEAPRGEDIHWSMLGDNQKLFRWRARASTYANWPPLRYMLRGNTISDAPLIVASIDPCYSCTDRVTMIDIRKGKSVTVPYSEIERYGRERKNSPLK